MQILLSRKSKLFWLFFSVVLIIGTVVISTGKAPEYKRGSSYTYDLAVGRALSLFKKDVSLGIDMSKGPCLSNDLMPGWVVDVVHTPREQMDNQPENECQAFIEGRSTHFVELDTNGNVVRVQ